jgi:N6-L-threonylcarbamoyladenine synthase
LIIKGQLVARDQADLAAGFQAAVVDVLTEKTRRALAHYTAITDTPVICVAGGVAANMAIRGSLEKLAAAADARFVAPPLALCTDNAAMIAYAALEQADTRQPDDLSLSARPRWPLDQHAPAMLGSGKKGAKA